MEPQSADAADSLIQPADNRVISEAGYSSSSESRDYFVVREGLTFAGVHLLVDFWEACHLDSLNAMENAMREAVVASGATLLHIHLHHFTPSGGISGVAVLAESHISVHTWPERDYAAFDIFMCGDAQPEQAVPVLEKHLAPGRVEITEQLRGIVRK